jgi:indolepyruvate ferredoxin oxidoreductase, beta subunit
MDNFNVYMIGVGGQGIGMLSEILIRAADYAGYRVKAVDTHGLAQRGGTVISHLRMGNNVHSPMVPEGEADLVVALERNEALRGMNSAARRGGVLVYYNTVWQPLGVRLGEALPVEEDAIEDQCSKRDILLYKVGDARLSDPRMQNMVVLSVIAKNALIPNVLDNHYQAAMKDLLTGALLEKNLTLFD